MTSKWSSLFFRAAAVLLVLLLSGEGLYGYSVLTHEEIVDLVWTSEIRPLLLQRFPDLTERRVRTITHPVGSRMAANKTTAAVTTTVNRYLLG